MRERERQTKRQTGRDRDREYECYLLYVFSTTFAFKPAEQQIGINALWHKNHAAS